jgi:hypothetical protein
MPATAIMIHIMTIGIMGRPMSPRAGLHRAVGGGHGLVEVSL